jgi:serine/threonine protein kinase
MANDPATIGRYRIESVLGRGAMGVVYRAHDPEIDRRVAIKLIRADLLDGSERADFIARFRHEAQAAGRCTHPNIVTIYDFATHEGNPFLAMEFVDGVALKQLCSRPTSCWSAAAL